MSAEGVYARAWDLLRQAIKREGLWGTPELDALMSECLERAVKEKA